ncbi:Ribosomal protein lysine methyltransferase [Lecanora helva]
MPLQDLLLALGNEIEDPEEETFVLFSQSLPSQNLGFVDPNAKELNITVAKRDLTIIQSPGLLSSNREGGTTGAVVWKITPLVAEWLVSEDNVLFKTSAIGEHSTVMELGCGISGIVAVSLALKIRKYIATDQDYILKALKLNIAENAPKKKHNERINQRAKSKQTTVSTSDAIHVMALDWESNAATDLVRVLGDDLSNEPQTIDVVVACDCIYNEYLIEPFVRVCTETCQLSSSEKPAFCVIAQQLRSESVFSEWLEAFHRAFRVWRIPDHLLTEELREGSGFVVHVGVTRSPQS